MWTQAQQHQGLGFRQSRGTESVLFLKSFHGVTRRRTPYAVRLVVEEAGFDKGVLDFPDPGRLDANVEVMTVVPVTPPMPARGVSSLPLSCRQPDVRRQERCQGDQHGPSNPSPAASGSLHVFHINAEYQPGTWS